MAGRATITGKVDERIRACQLMMDAPMSMRIDIRGRGPVEHMFTMNDTIFSLSGPNKV